MSDTNAGHHAILTEQVMLARLRQSDEMRAFFIEMWQQNPTLAMQGGTRVQALLSPLHASALNPDSSLATDAIQNQGVVGRASARHVGLKPDLRPDELSGLKQRGISLVELIMFIVIVSVALAGILLVMNVTTKSSADPLVRKQAIAAAESLLEEIQLQDFSPPAGAVSVDAMNATDDRTVDYHTALDYHQFPLDDGVGIYPPSGGTPVAGLENYKVKVTVESPLAVDWNGIPAASAALITVTVTDPQNNPVSISGYRTDYCCSNLE